MSPTTLCGDRTRTYQVRTYGCQMNVHDSERLTGLLEDAGYAAADDGAVADLVVFNTCAVRENADNRLYGNLGHLKPVKDRTPGMQIAVGGCLPPRARAPTTPPVRHPRAPQAGQGPRPGHADRGRRLPCAEGPRHHHRPGA